MNQTIKITISFDDDSTLETETVEEALVLLVVGTVCKTEELGFFYKFHFIQSHSCTVSKTTL